MKTATRLLRLLTLLQARRDWTGGALQAELGVDVRTVRRDVDRLRELGYEIDSSAGLGGGYHLGAGRDLPPLRLDDQEVVAIAVALGTAVAQMPSLQDAAVSALVKLDQLLPARLKKKVGALQAMTVSLAGPAGFDPALLTAMAAACRDAEQLAFWYRDGRDVRERRTVQPARLAHTGRRWYLVAWDLGREAWRTFRVDRVDARAGLQTGPRFVPRPPPSELAGWVSRSITVEPFAQQATLRLRGSLVALAEQVPPWCGELREDGPAHCTLTVGAPTPEAVAALIVHAGVEFELRGPASMRGPLRDVAQRLSRGAAGTRRSAPAGRTSRAR